MRRSLRILNEPGEHEFAVRHPFDADDTVGECTDFLTAAVHDDDLEA